MNKKIFFRTLLFAFIGWSLCGAVMGIGTQITNLDNTLIIHLIAAPVIFIVLSIIYFKSADSFNVLAVARFFTLFVILVDFFVVALLIEKNFDMFESAVGTWIPFILIYFSTYITGNVILRKRNEANHSNS